MQTPSTNTKQGRVLPFSISSLSAFETCPKRFYLTRIAKVVTEPQSAATMHVNEVHKALELAVKGSQGLPEKYRSYQPIVTKVLASPGVKTAERRFGLTQAFTPTEFFAKDVWVRGVIDLTVDRGKSAIVLDWKTGKPKMDMDQLKLTAAVTFAEKPYLKTVHTGYVWLAHNKVDKETFSREDAPGIWQEFVPRVQRMVRAAEINEFPPRPSGLCREWCPVGRSNCEFCGKA